ncbi:hypothetical protein [Bdellovibrio sp. HCB209]|uniref:hypothetical protein n=1 Tax=Bdellovibrio sp. HCB209 TaxID=3394354 RepID=UPI0039B3B43F
MNRKNILAAIRSFLEKQGKNSCFEITVFPQEINGKQIIRRRSIIVVDLPANKSTELGQFLWMNGLSEQGTSIQFYQDLDSLVTNSQIALDDMSLDNNWRGRVLRFDTDFNFQETYLDFEKKFLRSYFRFIISKYNENYFSKYDITPTFISPGTSTPGFPDFENATEDFVRYLENSSIRANAFAGIADADFDFIRIFISKGQGRPFESVSLWNQQIISLNIIYNYILQFGPDKIVSEMNDSITSAFGN